MGKAASLTVLVTGVVVIKVLVLAGAVMDMPDVVVESLSNAVTAVAVALDCVVSVSYFVKVLSDVVLAVDIGVEVVLADKNVNVSTAVVTALEFPIPITKEEFNC